MNYGLDDDVVAPENLVIIMRTRSEVGNLGFTVEWVHQNEIEHVVCDDSLVVDFGGHKAEMRATLDSEAFWIESDVFKLVELDEAHEFFIFFKLQDELGLLICLERVHQDQFGVTKVIGKDGQICLLLLEHAGVSLDDFIVLVLNAKQCPWDSRLKDRRLITFGHVDSLEHFVDGVVLVVLFVVQPHIDL